MCVHVCVHVYVHAYLCVCVCVCVLVLYAYNKFWPYFLIFIQKENVFRRSSRRSEFPFHYPKNSDVS